MKSNNLKDFLTFLIDDKTFAVPLLSIQSIVGNPDIEPITDSYEFVVGIFYINKRNIPILDLRTILNSSNILYPDKTCVVIVKVAFKGAEKLVGFIVDSLFNTYHIQVSEIKKLPTCEENEFIDGVSNQEKKMFLLLNLEKIINNEKVIYFLNQFWNFEGQCNDRDNRREKNGV